MLSKLLKHEFRATARIMLPVYLLLLASAGLSSLFMHLASSYRIRAMVIFRGITATIFVIALIGAGIVTLVLMIYRFYKNYMTEEGYLMFTLPATVGRLIWSKLIVALVWSVATIAAEFLALIISAATRKTILGMIPDLAEIWKEIVAVLPAGQVIAYSAEVVAIVVLTALTSYLMFYAAIALGHGFANHKILLSVLFYIGFSVVLQIIVSFAGIQGIASIAESSYFDNHPLDMMHTLLIGTAVYSLVTSAVFYLITHLNLKKRLNLQ